MEFNKFHSEVIRLCGIEWSDKTISERSETIEKYAAYAYAHGYRVDVAATNLKRDRAFMDVYNPFEGTIRYKHRHRGF